MTAGEPLAKQAVKSRRAERSEESKEPPEVPKLEVETRSQTSETPTRQLERNTLKQEINNIYYRIALARDAQLTSKKMATVDVDPSSTLASWKVPDIEQSARFFDEKARFYDTSKDMRRYGKKHVPPPIAENLQQLFEEKLQIEKAE